MSQLTEETVLNGLRQIIDPDLRKDIVTLGFIHDLAIDSGNVSFRIVLTTPACPVKEEMESQATEIVRSLEGVTDVKVTMDAEVPQGRGIKNNVAIEGVKNIIAVSSGKGGVGKSTVAVNLAVALAADGAKVGIMDADVYGPNVPIMLGVGYGQPEVIGNQLMPIKAHGVKMISMAVLVPPDKPMVLRGPMLHGVVRQFLSDVNWGELDYLIVDRPPGTGDVQLSLAQLVPVQGAVLVTTPQEVSLSDVRRAVKMFAQVNVPVVGVIENMSYSSLPATGTRFSAAAARNSPKNTASFPGLARWGVREGGDKGIPVVVSAPDSPQSAAFRHVAEEVARQISIEAMKPELVIMSRAK
jgi:ATP-binding protein involved in chromosome partitioning